MLRRGARRRVLDLQLMRRSARAVRRAQSLRYDAFAAERAGVLVDRRAVALIVRIEISGRDRRIMLARNKSRSALVAMIG